MESRDGWSAPKSGQLCSVIVWEFAPLPSDDDDYDDGDYNDDNVLILL